MHFCKPNPGFFEEIVSQLGVKAQDCLMVGDDVELDILPARELGIKTFYLGSNCEVADYRGDMRDFLQVLGELNVA